ncbi:MAG: hypothetical protein ACRC41_02150 [Sarcina sp.]
MGNFFNNKVTLATITVSTLAISIILVASSIKNENTHGVIKIEKNIVESEASGNQEKQMDTYFLEQRDIDRSSVNELPNYIIGKIETESVEEAHDTIHIVVAGEYTSEGLQKIAEKEMELYTAKSNVKTLTIGFYEKLNQIGHEYEMGYIEYAFDRESNDKNYSLINKLKFPASQTISDINVRSVKDQIENKFGESIADIKKDGSFLRIKIEENSLEKNFNEFTIAKYTDVILENELEGIEYIQIKIESNINSIEAILNMNSIQEQNGKYFDIDYIKNNIK